MARKKTKRSRKAVSATDASGTLAVVKASRKTDMLNMPVDIMHEILLYLYPRDLLSLSRTSKTTHSFLVRKSSVLYWREALKKIDGLPPCPDSLIEPAWAALWWTPFCTVSWSVFASGCIVCLTPIWNLISRLQVCGKGSIRTIYWEFLMRMCSSCKSQL
ncbi:uncharacterized protein B0H18DRAFT_881408 [Fomitopsis serialis]|uniref:uncharacterized protein n=1 Tax=Fomitopsis serialis TaxID=139415 RepID=UPI0020086F1C|nr:uncharacterized protein B0H18DRAFT_881408 [Neoantrodia serialis]KAH9920097.1 hypothetical protein B0H18DRAFT_881408 [Neoantrodia serialis]